MSKYKDRLCRSAAALFLFGGLVWLFTGLFLPQHLQQLWLCLAVGTAVILSCGLTGGRPKRMAPFLWLAAGTAFVLLFRAGAADGMAEGLNGILDAWKQVHPKNYDVFTVRDPGNIPYFLAPVSALLAFLCLKAAEQRTRALGVLLLLLLIGTSAVFLPILSSVQITAAALLSLLLGILIRTYCRPRPGAPVSTAFFGVWLRTAAVLLLTASLLLGLCGTERPESVLRGEEQLRCAADALRYGGMDGTGLTEGNLSRVGARQSGGTVMLKVTMSAPHALYLRGFIGEEYTGDRWKPLPDSVLYENADSFAFLHQNGFYAQSQLASAAAAADTDGKRQGEQNILQIENVGLPSRYLYTPYGLTAPSALLDPHTIGDSAVPADGFFGMRSYTAIGDNSLVRDYSKLAASLLADPDADAVREYLNREAVYNRFVYEQYTAIPADIDAYLFRQLGSYAKQDGERHFDYTFAKQNILYYLTHAVTYDETVSCTDAGIDFVLNFLDGTKRGYDVHYASAAVMLFRYYGIPARFAEGYIVTTGEAQTAQSGDTLTLDSSHAHAWAEYYRDGIGWLPFEATPTYLAVTEQPDTYREISGLIGQTPENEHTEALQPDEPDKNEQPALLSFWLKNRLTIVLALAVAAAVLLLVLFIGWLVRERRKTAARKALFLSEDRRLAVCAVFGYILDLLAAGGMPAARRPVGEYAEFLDADLREAYRVAAAIWQEAMFSRNELTEEQRSAVVALKDELWRRLWSKAGPLKRLQIRWMYFL